MVTLLVYSVAEVFWFKFWLVLKTLILRPVAFSVIARWLKCSMSLDAMSQLLPADVAPDVVTAVGPAFMVT